MKANTIFKIVGWVLLGISMGVLLAFVLGVAVMLLWNWLVPAISNGAVGEITYWQAVGIFILCHLLFKGHHEGHQQGQSGHGQPRFLKGRIHGLLGKTEPEAGEAEGGA